MNKKRGRPMSLLARMKGANREEIRNTIIYGTPAWRFIRLRQLLGDERKRLLGEGRELLPNYLSQGLRAMEAHVVHARALATLRGKPPVPAKWLKVLARLPKPPPLPGKTCIQAACLWRELSQQLEHALVIGDDEWLDELAKAIREGESLKQRASSAQAAHSSPPRFLIFFQR